MIWRLAGCPFSALELGTPVTAPGGINFQVTGFSRGRASPRDSQAPVRRPLFCLVPVEAREVLAPRKEQTVCAISLSFHLLKKALISLVGCKRDLLLRLFHRT